MRKDRNRIRYSFRPGVCSALWFVTQTTVYLLVSGPVVAAFFSSI